MLEAEALRLSNQARLVISLRETSFRLIGLFLVVIGNFNTKLK